MGGAFETLKPIPIGTPPNSLQTVLPTGQSIIQIYEPVGAVCIQTITRLVLKTKMKDSFSVCIF